MRRAVLPLIVACALAPVGCSFVAGTALLISCGPYPYGGERECGGAWIRHLLPEELRRPVPMPPGVEPLKWDTTPDGRVCYHSTTECDLLPCCPKEKGASYETALYYLACGPEFPPFASAEQWPECRALKAKLFPTPTPGGP